MASDPDPPLQAVTDEPGSVVDDGAGDTYRFAPKRVELLRGRSALALLAELAGGGRRYQDLHERPGGSLTRCSPTLCGRRRVTA